MAAGVRADIITGADAVSIDAEFDHSSAGALDVVVDGVLHERLTVQPGRFSTSLALPAGEHRMELWLPQVGQTWLSAVNLNGSYERSPIAAARWLTYGSSITQCATASGPSRTWPAIVSRALDWDLTCLGFGGQCHLDPIAARTIAATPVDIVSLCIGINIYGGATFGARTFAGQASAFIEQVRSAHPMATIVVITPIHSPSRETTPNIVTLTLTMLRGALAEVVDVLATTDDRLHLLTGPSVFDAEDVNHLPDGVHPDPVGYERMGQRLASALKQMHPM